MRDTSLGDFGFGFDMTPHAGGMPREADDGTSSDRVQLTVRTSPERRGNAERIEWRRGDRQSGQRTEFVAPAVCGLQGALQRRENGEPHGGISPNVCYEAE